MFSMTIALINLQLTLFLVKYHYNYILEIILRGPKNVHSTYNFCPSEFLMRYLKKNFVALAFRPILKSSFLDMIVKNL